MKRTDRARLHVSLLAAITVVAACSSRKRSQPKDASADSVVAILERIESPDAGPQPELGIFMDIEARFARECPASIPDYDPNTRLGQLQGGGGWSCLYRTTDLVPGATAGTIRQISLYFRDYYDTQFVRSVTVSYDWTRISRAPPRECAEVAAEVVAYVSDLMGLGAVDHRRLVDRLQRDDGTQGWLSAAVGGQTIYFQHEPSRGRASCLAVVSADVSLDPDHRPIVPVQLGGNP